MILWHHDIHENAGQSLVYFQLSFSPVYRREEISEAIRACLAEKEVHSYCIYETYGLYDIMIRVWLPHAIPGPTFTALLKERLRHLDCTRVLPFFVSEQALHWAWWKEQAIRPSKEHVRSLDTSVIARAEEPNATGDVLQRLEERHLLRRYDKKNEGIKFFVVIPPPTLGMMPPDELVRKIRASLQQFLVSSREITEPSLYTGDGFAWLLIKAKLAFGSYLAINEFVHRINALGAEGFSIRTYTYLATGSEHPFTVEQESVGNGRRQGIRQITDGRDYLARVEDDQFEVKASVQADIQRLVNDPTQPINQNAKLAIEGVIKTIAAFLNTSGGELLIGALEASKFSKHVDAANPVLISLPRMNNWLVCGLDYDYRFSKSKDFDGFSITLVELVREHIGAEASALISIEPITVERKELAIVRVPKGLRWYYVDDQRFYVRASGSSIPLEGQEREGYQKSSGR